MYISFNLLHEKNLHLNYAYSGVYLSLNDNIIPNHGYVMISDIGYTDNTALLCITNRPVPPGGGKSGGNWFAPDGDKVGSVGSTTVPGFGRNRGDMVVRLRRNDGTPEEGIYHCVVEDADSIPETVFVGLYNSGGGNEKTNTNIFLIQDPEITTFSLNRNHHNIW